MRTRSQPRCARWRSLAPVAGMAMALALGACHHAPPTGNATPATAVEASLNLAALGEFDGLVKNRLPPAAYATWRAEWQHARTERTPATRTQTQQFAEVMQLLTAPDAEARLAKRLEPQLAGMKGGAGQPLPIFASIFQAAIIQMINASPQLGPAQRQLALSGLDALMAWTATTDFSNMKKARRAIDIACATARGLHVQTLAQWQALDYAQAMQAYGAIWKGLEQVMAIYGLDVGKSLTDAKVTVVPGTGDTAVVKLDLEFAGKPLSGQWPMRKIAGHWYDSDLLQAWAKAHPATSASIGTAPAAASTAPGAAAPVATPTPQAVPATSTRHP